MKIICIHNRYTLQSKESNKKLNSETINEPILFIKPDTSILKTKDFYIPEFSNEVYCEIGLTIKISKRGKYILPENAIKHYEKIGFGLDFTAMDLHDYLVKNGLPWEKSKSFDGSAIISDLFPIENFNDKINICIQKNKNIIQNINISDFFIEIDDLISYTSKYFTLRVGDLVFIKISSDTIKINENDIIEAYFDDKKILITKVF